MIQTARRPFTVPRELEAHEPPEDRGIPRDHVQLLVSERASGNVQHAMFVDIVSFLQRGVVLVVNDSATLPAALEGRRRRGETLGVHLSSQVSGTLWVVEPRASISAAETVTFPGGGSATFLSRVTEAFPRLWYARLDVPEPIDEYLPSWGRPIRYRYISRDIPIAAYQTVFARIPGSAEMPSAGRPFTPRVIADLERRGVEIVAVTLHCGVSSAERPEPPPAERFEVGPLAAQRVNAARREGRRVIAVGTTVVRALESAVAANGDVIASRGWTDLIVTPQRGVRTVDGLLTGLHEPEASHLTLLEAFLSPDDLEEVYEAAVTRRYLWHEFGDVHLIL